MSASTANLISFQVGAQKFAGGLEHVKETLVLRRITRVFLTPPWIAGIVNLRGDIVAVIDLSAFLGMARTEIRPDTRIVLLRSGGKTAGLLVDKLDEVRAFDLSMMQPPPTTLPAEGAALLKGLITLADGAPLLVLDLVKLFESERLRQFARKT